MSAPAPQNSATQTGDLQTDGREPGAAVYVHFPWCLHRCAYCDFATTAHRDPPRERYTALIERELALRAESWAPERVTSVFFGGGTPSLWGPRGVGRVLQAIDAWSPIDAQAEITLEANPGALESGDLGAYARAGVNRVSVGVQATEDRRLRALDRLHDAAAARATLAELSALLASGALRSASADLLFGAPGQGMAELERDVATLLDADLPHLSAYALTVEPETPLGRMVARGHRAAPDDDLQAAMLEALPALVAPWGLARYEVSNYARPGHASAHNLVYWRGGHYLALGVGAHGFLPLPGAPGVRYGNHRSSAVWMAALAKGRLAEVERETLGAAAHRDELVLTGLRLREGIEPSRWVDRLGPKLVADLVARADARIAAGAPLRWAEGRLQVTESGTQHLDRHILSLLDGLDP